MRPPLMVEYEMRELKQTWTGIQQSIKQAAGTLQRSNEESASLQPDAHHAVQSCTTIMDAGMCPFLASLPPNQHWLTKEQRREQNKQRFVSAKRKCHAKSRLAILAPPVPKRKKLSAPVSVPSRVPSKWAAGPYEFAQRLMQGECGKGSGCSSSSYGSW